MIAYDERKTYEKSRELECLYAISNLIKRRDLSQKELFQRIVNCIPSAWHYSCSPSAQIIIKGHRFRTPYFNETGVNQSCNIEDHGKIAGSLEVFCDSPFHQDKKYLIDIIAERLGQIVEQNQYQCEKLAREHSTELMKKAHKQLQHEIAERKHMQNALQESEVKYALLVEKAKDWVVIVQDGLCKFANRATENITGYTIEEIKDKPLRDMVASECTDMDTQEQKPCCLTSGNVNFACETKLRRKDGRIINVEASTAIIQFNGKPATMGIVRDVTERKRMEEEFVKMEKCESIGVLASGIAHDFNNLLTSIIGSLSLIEVYIKQDSTIFKILNRAKRASQHAVNLIQQLFTFSKNGTPITKPVTVQKLLKEIACFSLRGSKARIHYSIPESLWPAEIDESQISQVINNLIINADQAMPHGGVIKLSAENVTINAKDNLPMKAGEYIKICIQDQGIGIPENHISHIFDPYFTTKKKGSGLGLASCYSIIKKHRGYITVKSEVGAGTIFYIYLPVPKEKIVNIRENRHDKLTKGKGKILFMDDDEALRDTMGDILLYLGYQIEFAKEGNEAIDLYKKAWREKNPFDLVVLDLTIPGGRGGKETMKKLCEIDPDVKAIISSGYPNDPAIFNYKKYGFKGAIIKPYEINKFSMLVKELIT
ncbi:MAG: ATP-binding protein [bacterium]